MKKSQTQVEIVRLSPRFRDRLGNSVDPVSYSFGKRLSVSGFAVVFILIIVIGIRYFQPRSFPAGFLRISISFSLILLLFVALASVFNSKAGQIRYRADEAFLWVSQVSFLKAVIEGGGALVATALGTYSVYTVISGLIHSTGNIWDAAPRSAWVWGAIFLPLSIYMWRTASLALRSNRGIRLSPDRVGLSQKSEDLYVSWNQIRHLGVEEINLGTAMRKNIVPCLRIGAEDGGVFHVEAAELGSDPNAVAALMCYYLDRPQERHLLARPEVAIGRFREAQV